MQQKISIKKNLDIPEDIFCAITSQIMTDPVILIESGNTYEREAIQEWLQKRDTDPLTGLKIHSKAIAPNLMAKRLINSFLDDYKKVNPDIIYETYLPKFLIEELILSMQKNNTKLFSEILQKDVRLLKDNLKDNKNLLILACESASFEILDILLNKLGATILEFSSIESDNGFSLFLMASRRLGLEGAKIMIKALSGKQTDLQEFLISAAKDNDLVITKILLLLGAIPTSELLRKIYADKNPEMIELLKLFGSNIQEEEKPQKATKNLDTTFLKAMPLQPNYKSEKILQSHSSQVSCIAVLSDNLLVSGSFDRTLKIWDLNKPKGKECVQTLMGHTFMIKCVAKLSEKKIISGSMDMDGELKVWDLTKEKGKECIQTLRGHMDMIWCVASLSHNRVISGSGDYTLKVWDLSKPKGKECIKTLRSHNGNVQSITALSDNFVVSGSNDGTLKLWDLSKPDGKELVKTLKGHKHFVTSVSVISNNQIISSSDDGTLKIWDLQMPQGSECIKTMLGHNSHINCVNVLLPNQLVSGSDDGVVKIWDISKPKGQECIQTLQGNNSNTHNSIKSMGVFSNNQIVSGHSDATLKLWRDENRLMLEDEKEKILNKVLGFFKAENEKIFPTPEVALRRACSGLRPKNDSGLGDQINVIRYLITQVIDVDAYSPTNGMTALHHAVIKNQIENVAVLLSAGASYDIQDRNEKTAKDYALESSNENIKKVFNAEGPIAINQDVSNFLQAPSLNNPPLKKFGNNANFFSPQKIETPMYECQHILQGHGDAVRCIAILPSDKHLVSGSDDQTIKLWSLSDIPGQECLKTLRGHSGSISGITILSATHVVSSSVDKTLRLWDLSRPAGQECIRILNGHTEHVYGVAALSKNLVVSASWDMAIKVWDLTRIPGFECVKTLFGHKNFVQNVIALTNNCIASTSHDGTVKIWDLDNSPMYECIHTLKGHSDSVMSVSMLSRNRLISASIDNTLKVWDLNKPKGSECVQTLRGHKDYVRCVAVLSENRIISGSFDNTLKIWDLNNPPGLECIQTLDGNEGCIRSIVVLKDGRVVNGLDNHTIKIWKDKNQLEVENKETPIKNVISTC